MTIKIVFDKEKALTWAVRLVQFGDMYGVGDALVHDEQEALVEFYDTRFAHTALGQFVSRYNLSTLLNRKTGQGLQLDAGTQAWQLSSKAMDELVEWLTECAVNPPAPEVPTLLEGMRRKALQMAKADGRLFLNAPYADNRWWVELFEDGSTTYGGYAQESRGTHGTVADLVMWELAGMLAP